MRWIAGVKSWEGEWTHGVVRLTRLPVTEKIRGSNPLGSAFASPKLGYGETKSAGDERRRDSLRRSSKSEGELRRSYGETKSVNKIMRSAVYIIKCSDNRFYVGCTNNISDRIDRHNKGYVPATADRLPIQLAIAINFQDKYKAFQFEKYLKSGSGRAFTKKHFL